LDRFFHQVPDHHGREYGSLQTSMAPNTKRIYERIATFFQESKTSRSKREDLQKLLQIQLLLDKEVRENIKMPHRIKKPTYPFSGSGYCCCWAFHLYTIYIIWSHREKKHMFF
jgi:hypothetical protein